MDAENRKLALTVRSEVPYSQFSCYIHFSCMFVVLKGIFRNLNRNGVCVSRKKFSYYFNNNNSDDMRRMVQKVVK